MTFYKTCRCLAARLCIYCWRSRCRHLLMFPGSYLIYSNPSYSYEVARRCGSQIFLVCMLTFSNVRPFYLKWLEIQVTSLDFRRFFLHFGTLRPSTDVSSAGKYISKLLSPGWDLSRTGPHRMSVSLSGKMSACQSLCQVNVRMSGKRWL